MIKDFGNIPRERKSAAQIPGPSVRLCVTRFTRGAYFVPSVLFRSCNASCNARSQSKNCINNCQKLILASVFRKLHSLITRSRVVQVSPADSIIHLKTAKRHGLLSLAIQI